MGERLVLMFKHAQKVMFALIMMVMFGTAPSKASEVSEFIPDAELVGEARFSVFLFPIYDASLYAPNGKYEKGGPLALVLNYLFDLDKESLVNQTVEALERRKLGTPDQIAKWKAILNEHFFDVVKKDKILIAFPDPETVSFSTNDGAPTTVVDSGFALAFKDLWLGDNIRNKKFQNQLLGMN